MPLAGACPSPSQPFPPPSTFASVAVASRFKYTLSHQIQLQYKESSRWYRFRASAYQNLQGTYRDNTDTSADARMYSHAAICRWANTFYGPEVRRLQSFCTQQRKGSETPSSFQIALYNLNPATPKSANLILNDQR